MLLLGISVTRERGSQKPRTESVPSWNCSIQFKLFNSSGQQKGKASLNTTLWRRNLFPTSKG